MFGIALLCREVLDQHRTSSELVVVTDTIRSGRSAEDVLVALWDHAIARGVFESRVGGPPDDMLPAGAFRHLEPHRQRRILRWRWLEDAVSVLVSIVCAFVAFGMIATIFVGRGRAVGLETSAIAVVVAIVGTRVASVRPAAVGALTGLLTAAAICSLS